MASKREARFVKPLRTLPRDMALRLEGLIFDLDDTFLSHGALTERAYASLFALQKSGLLLIPCTGRPAGWGDVIARQWPVDAVISENGAVFHVKESGGKVRTYDDLPENDRKAERAMLMQLGSELIREVPAAAFADDNRARLTDVTIDIGEFCKVDAKDVRAMRDVARDRGVRTTESSVHLHLTHSGEDKASGAVRLLSRIFHCDSTVARFRFAYAGDSANDAAAFAAFNLTFAVANVRRHVSKFSVLPAYVTEGAMGEGFSELALILSELRAT